MSKKWLVVSISVALLVFGTLAFAAAAPPGSDNASTALQRLRAVLKNLQNQIDDLQDQIDNLAMKAAYEVMSVNEIDPVSPHTIFLSCDDGDKVTGGGFEHRGGLEILASRPDHQLGTWRVEAVTKGATNETLKSYAICFDYPPLRP